MMEMGAYAEQGSGCSGELVIIEDEGRRDMFRVPMKGVLVNAVHYSIHQGGTKASVLLNVLLDSKMKGSDTGACLDDGKGVAVQFLWGQQG